MWRNLLPCLAFTGMQLFLFPAFSFGEVKTIKGDLKAPKADHTIKLKKGELYVIDMTSKNFDTFVLLKDPNGQLVGADDDNGEGLNSQMFHVPKVDGNFTILATSFSKNGRGAYKITIAGVKDYKGKVFKGVFKGQRVPHTFKMKAGTRYTINMAGDFDTYLYLKDPAGNQVAANDDGGSRLNSRLQYSADKDGDYTIEAGSFGAGQGNYYIAVTPADKK